MNNTIKYSANESTIVALKRSLTCGAALGALLMGSAAFGQAAESGQIETVYVTGYRASLEKSIDIKRNTAEMVDAITAEDIGKFPDSNLAESLQRLPGVAVDRDNGEGRTITVRGLGSSFTRVTMNGLQALSTAGANESGTQPNRDRQFDFNTFASELFSELKVQKTASAATEDGSLGATVSLSTPHPLDFGEKFVLSGQNAWYEMGKPFNPRVSALVSETFFGEKVGVLLSGAYTIRHQYQDQYFRNPGQSDFAYRGSDFKYAALSGSAGFNGATDYKIRNGFAAPAGTSCNGTTTPYYTGVIPGNNLTYIPYCDALRGSDATAYGLVNTPQGWGLRDTNTGSGTSSAYASPGSLTLIPALPTLRHQELYQQRIGLTGSVQWQASDNTLFTLDGLFSTAYQNSINYDLAPIGLNRNNTNNSLNAITVPGTGLTTAQKAAAPWSTMFTTCAPQTGTSTQAPINCYGVKQLSPIDYYTSSAYGYNPNGADAIATNIAFIGRPSTKLIDAQVDTATPYGAAKYLKLDNVDFRSGADQAYYTTQFSQLSLNGTHTFTDRFKVNGTAGWSHSYNHQTGVLAEFNHMDNRFANTGQYFIWDDTAHGNMPSINYGFDVSQPTNWSFVKNYSALRHFQTMTDNKYRTLMLNATYALTDELTLEVGTNLRIFDFTTAYYQRAMKDVINPSLAEAGATSASVAQVVKWGAGLNAPAGTPTSWTAPDLVAFEKTFGFTCNCENDYGDWRLTNLFNPASTGTAGQTYNVSEHSKAYYAQLSFQDFNILGRPLMGNIGARFVTTEIKSTGHALQGQVIAANSSYNDFLPSINLAYMLTDDMMIRMAASKVIARPSLQYMAPSITAMTIPSTVGATTGMTMAYGNTDLKPYRAKTFDIGWEWYFDKGAVLAVSGFVKWISANPQVVLSGGHLSNFMSPDQLSIVQSFYASGTAQYNYIAADGEVTVTQPLNGPGGVLEGIEVTYQQNLDFIPAFMGGEGFGVNANYTKIRSVQHYIVNSTVSAGVTTNVLADGPWNGASPDAWNMTVYYDGSNWEARVSGAFRSGYLYLYPVAGGSDQLGMGNAPLVNDFGYSRNTLNLDFSASYDIDENIALTLDALNITNQPDRRWAYENTPQTTRYQSSGRQLFVGFRMKY